MIRVNLLPKDERIHKHHAPVQFKAADYVLPLIVLAAVSAIVMGTVVAQRMAIATVSKSIADVDAQSRFALRSSASIDWRRKRPNWTSGWVSSPSSRRAAPRVCAPWTSSPAAFRITCG